MVLISLQNGQSLDGDSFRQCFAADIYQLDLHYAISRTAAGLLSDSTELEEIVTNILSLKCSLIRELTAIAYHQQEIGNIESVTGPEIIRDILSHHICPDRLPTFRSAPPKEFVDKGPILSLIIKALAHRTFRILSRPLHLKIDVVRAWVDVTFEMYRDEIPSSQIRVFPFPLRPTRQFRFIAGLKQRGLRWSIDGLPYSLCQCFIIPFLRGRKRLNAFARVEFNAFKAYADTIQGHGIKNVYTSDEFEVGAIAAGEAFKRAGIRYINSAHGVGFYCPRVCYSEFRYITRSQKDFYETHNPGLVTRRRPDRTEANKPLTVDGIDRIVFVHQGYSAKAFKKESEVEIAILQALSRLATEQGLKLLVKCHPNASNLARWLKRHSIEAEVHQTWNEIARRRCIFVEINSTAYYMIREMGPVLVYQAPSFSPHIYLEGEFETFDLTSLPNKLLKLLKADQPNREVNRC
jgi:hypothetical protein